MRRLYALMDVAPTPEGRRAVLLAVKQAAKGLKCKLWLDVAGLHVQGLKAVFEAAAGVLPAVGLEEQE
jgi:hypothetical protein